MRESCPTLDACKSAGVCLLSQPASAPATAQKGGSGDGVGKPDKIRGTNFAYCIIFLRNAGERIRAIRLAVDALRIPFKEARAWVDSVKLERKKVDTAALRESLEEFPCDLTAETIEEMSELIVSHWPATPPTPQPDRHAEGRREEAATPETDAEAWDDMHGDVVKRPNGAFVVSSFARKLERQRDEARQNAFQQHYKDNLRIEELEKDSSALRTAAEQAAGALEAAKDELERAVDVLATVYGRAQHCDCGSFEAVQDWKYATHDAGPALKLAEDALVGLRKVLGGGE